MTDGPSRLNRRDFLQLAGLSSAAVLTGCATNPVTGKNELMLYDRSDEIAIDREASPHQFSADFGAVRDQRTNEYVSQTGRNIAMLTHRPDMPYTFRGVNASYVNAYAFPGGTIAVTRGILVSLENEAELAALLGHELGHVNARHTAHALSRSIVLVGGLALVSAVMESAEKYKDYAPLVAGLGGIGAGALLARYSRDNERQADNLGMQYMTRAGHNPDGMVGLMQKLCKLQSEKPNVIELMFATHPMSDERLKTATARAQGEFAAFRSVPLERERYMDNTAAVRRFKGAVEAIQKGDELAGDKKWNDALASFKAALKLAPDDYEALLKIAQCHLSRENAVECLNFASKATAVNAEEPQAVHVCGLAQLRLRKYDDALASFSRYDDVLPGNPYTLFYMGRVQDCMGHKTVAVSLYRKFLEVESEGKEADLARERLTAWGVKLDED
jgi:predicted Zn-dependent protease